MTTNTTPAVESPEVPPAEQKATTSSAQKTSSNKGSAAKPAASKTPKTAAKTVDMSTDDDSPPTAMAAALQAVDTANLLSVATPVAAKKPSLTPGASEQQKIVHWMSSPRPVIAVQDSVEGTLDGSGLEIRLYGEGCLECSALIQTCEADEKLPPCHFSNDNMYCPAGHLRIRFVGEQMRITKKLQRAIEKHDVNRITQLISGLDVLDIRSREEVLKEVGLFNKA